jgi:predicted XRE-type DNA-binding protein
VKSTANKPGHITRGNVLDDLGFSPEQAAALKFRAQLYQAILKYSEKYSQKELQVILGEPQPRVSELLNGKIANKSIDKLLYYAGRLGIETRAKFVQAHKEVINSKIEKGYAAAQRGDLIDADEVRVRMAARKRARG